MTIKLMKSGGEGKSADAILPPMHLLRRALLILATLATALIAGFFYAYSVSVMPGLNATDPLAAI